MKDKPYILLGAVIGLALVLGGIFLFTKKGEIPSETPPEEAVASTTLPDGYVHRLIDGVLVPEEEQIEELYGVMIENSEDAWPHAALSEARLVFEAPVEGSIPRLLAYFDDTQDIDRIGPVRSARPYYVDWNEGFDGMYVHVGGSPEALGLIKRIGAASLDQFFWPFFWRDERRFAPHNVYTSIEMLSDGYEEREHEPVDFDVWNYTVAEPDERPEKQEVTIPFHPSSIYDAGWHYQPEENNYQRYQDDDVLKDEDQSEVFAKNIIVMFTDIDVIDEIGRRSVKTVGEGEALLFKDGRQTDVTWKKEGRSEQLEFFEGEKPVILNQGTTWIEVVPLSTELEVETE